MSDQLGSDQMSRPYNRYPVKTAKSLDAVCLSVLAAGALIRVVLRGRTSGESFSGNCISHLTRTARTCELQARSNVRDSAAKDAVTHPEDSRIHAQSDAWMCL